MKKRLLAILLFAAMVLALTACGGSEQPTGTIEEVTEAKTDAATEETLVTELETEETTAAEPTDEETTAEAGDFELGTVSNLVYENKYLGIGCKLPEGWVPYTEEEIAEMNGMVLDNIDESIKEQIENASYLYDMMAADANGMNNINVIVQKLNILQSASVDDVESALSATEEDLKTSLESMGVENIEFKIDRGQTFPADNYACGVLTGELSGYQLTERIVMFKVGNYLANVTVATFGDDVTEDIFEGFYALN